MITSSKIGTAVFDERIEFPERAFIQQQIQPFPGCQTAFLMLFFNSFRTASLVAERFSISQFLDFWIF